MNPEELCNFLRSLIDKKDFRLIKSELEDIFAADIAETFELLEPDEQVLIFRILNKDQAAEVFVHLSPTVQQNIVEMVRASHIDKIMDELSFDDKIDFLEEMPASIVKRILNNATETERKLINQFLNYPENSAGSLMTIEYVALKKEMTVEQALVKLRRVGMDKETIYTCYVLDSKRKLEGIISLRKIVLSEATDVLEDLMQEEILYVKTTDDQETVASMFKKYDVITVPVVDKENRMVGIITIDDIVDVIEEENTEDFYKMAAIAPSDEEYMETSVINLAKKRIGWLLFLMLSGSFTRGIMAGYENVLNSMVILTTFVPMIMNSAGNAGAQSSTVIIRGLTTGEIELKDWLKVFFKESRISLSIAFVMAIINFLKLIIFEKIAVLIALTVSLTLIITVVISNLCGCILPMIAKVLKKDPAVMAGPLITTIVDVMCLFIYFSLASMLLNL